MSFRIAARTILHLGQELITSDSIALYELIKNAYDAGSPSVRIEIEENLSRSTQRELTVELEKCLQTSIGTQPDLIDKHTFDKLESLKRNFTEGLIPTSPNLANVKHRIADITTFSELHKLVLECNRIVIIDTGKGMYLSDLEGAFLTIGTRAKLESSIGMQSNRVLLGEKGIGRLSSMRLGSRIFVETITDQDTSWNELNIDWSVFDHSSDAMLEDIPIKPVVGRTRSSSDVSGTHISISGLRRRWSKGYAESIANEDLCRLNDPFEQRRKFPIVLKHNGQIIPIPRVPAWLLDSAHASLKCSMQIVGTNQITCSGRMRYDKVEDTFLLDENQLLSIGKLGEDINVLNEVGPFEVELYWHNRTRLEAIDAIGDLDFVRKEQARWAGGLMLFRDGFRVLPYGGPSDDWLDIDKRALSRSGYKLNRRQLIGRVQITKQDNPNLIDQANREGLVDNEAKDFFREVLSHIIQTEFWHFLNKVERGRSRAKEPIPQRILAERLSIKRVEIEQSLTALIAKYPEISSETTLITSIQTGVASVSEIMNEVEHLAETYQEGRTNLLNLAGIGLTVEILAHELNRAIGHALATLRHMEYNTDNHTRQMLSNLDMQLKTVQKRLSILDPLSISGRNRKETFNLVQLVKEVVGAHDGQFLREGIKVDLLTQPTDLKDYKVTAVKGMIVQILENLISNSVYWLGQQKKLSPTRQSKISVTLDLERRLLKFTDNGIGIPRKRKDDVFEPFFTTRPSGQGKGLGLFIAREIAKYHGAHLTLADDGSENLKTFILTFGEKM